MHPRQVPSPIYGVTIDNICNLDDVHTSLEKLPRKPTSRLVFDEYVPASYYEKVIKKLHPITYLMGEIPDSSAMSLYSVKAFKKRTEEYLNYYGDAIDIWEIGNEVNGEWLGNNEDTVRKMEIAYDLVKAKEGVTALTLYFNEGCAELPDHEMFEWAKANINDQLKQGLDYVFVSFHPDDCPGIDPDWNKVFARLHSMFPHSKIGFGETGTKNRNKKIEYLHHFYSLRIDVPNYVGGYFWWYFCDDMVPHTNDLWQELSLAFDPERS